MIAVATGSRGRWPSSWRSASPSSTCRSLVVLISLVQRRPHLRLAAAAAAPSTGGTAPGTTRARGTALWTSVQAGLGATAIALVLGTMVAFAVGRYRFFGREAVSLLVVLPIALPGIVTGIALDNASPRRCSRSASSFGLFTVVVGHATFCVVVVYNNVLARLRRTGGSLEEASMDLGADVVQTFRLRHVPAGPLGAVRRRAARVRAVLRRDHRDHVHRRRRASRRCRSGSSATCPGPTRRRSSTWSRRS